MEFHPVARPNLGRGPRCVMVLSPGLVLLLATHAVASWSQFQGNAGHTGYVPTSGLPQQTTPTWTFRTISFLDPTPAVQFSPGIASDGENVFVSWLGSPSTVNGVNALKMATGAEVWEWMFQGNDAEEISASRLRQRKALRASLGPLVFVRHYL